MATGLAHRIRDGREGGRGGAPRRARSASGVWARRAAVCGWWRLRRHGEPCRATWPASLRTAADQAAARAPAPVHPPEPACSIGRRAPAPPTSSHPQLPHVPASSWAPPLTGNPLTFFSVLSFHSLRFSILGSGVSRCSSRIGAGHVHAASPRFSR